MKRFFKILISLIIIAVILYGAWTALETFDNMRAFYREELSRSQLLNQSAQQRITDLLEENANLRHQLSTNNEQTEEETENVRHQIIAD